jgi:acetyl esterase/lipase
MMWLAAVFLWAMLSFLTWTWAPLGFLWKLKIALTELGFWLGIATVLCVPVSWLILPESTRIYAVLGLLVAAVNLFTPTLQATHVARRHGLPSWLEGRFRGDSRAEESLRKSTYAYRHLPGGQALELDVWRSEHRDVADVGDAGSRVTDKPLIIVIHGGSWRSGMRQDMEWMNQKLAQRGHVVATVSYRLGEAGRFPAPIVDVTSAIEWLVQRADDFGFNRDDVTLLGRSAGGQIALVTAYSNPRVRRVVGIYSPADLLWGWENSRPWHIIDGKAVIRDYLGGTPSEVPSQYHHASAVNLVRPDSPPTLLLHGTRDELAGFEHTRRLRLALESKGVPHQVLELPWATHGFDWFSGGPGGTLLLEAVDQFLRRSVSNLYQNGPDSSQHF